VVSEARRAYLREYQNRWVQRRRQDWIDENGPCSLCNSWDELEVDHINAAEKEINVSVVWSMALTNPRRIAELKKCWVLCRECHIKKTSIRQECPRGEQVGNAKLTEENVREIRRLFSEGLRYPAIAKMFNVSNDNIGYICRGRTWRYVK
jgi:5-methylcytosine-specific restriction endonuclease McrA